jgi:hypothetical protein
MAIREINNKEYIEFTSDSLLPNTKLKLPVRSNPITYTKAVNSVLRNAFNGTGIDVAIGAKADNLTQAMASIFQDSDVAQIGYSQSNMIVFVVYIVCISYTIGSLMSISFKTIFASVPRLPIQANTNFKWKRIFVFSTLDDVDCSDAMQEFRAKATALGLTLDKTVEISNQIKDYSSYLSVVETSDPRVIVLFM